MKATIHTVNAAGLEEIREFLVARHKRGFELYAARTASTSKMLRAWADDADFQIAEGNPAAIELSSRDSVSGCTEEYRISDAGLSAEVVDLGDE